MLRRYQENLMSKPFELASPMMRPTTSLQTDLQRGQLFEERDHLPTMQFLYQCRLLQNIDPMQLENTLGRIHANTGKLLHGRLPCLRSPNGTSLWHIDAVGRRPPNRRRSSAGQIAKEIPPMRICLFDESELPAPLPFLQTRFALNRRADIIEHFVMNQHFDGVFFGESCNQSFAMLA